MCPNHSAKPAAYHASGPEISNRARDQVMIFLLSGSGIDQAEKPVARDADDADLTRMAALPTSPNRRKIGITT
ncbi:hypothetical protein GCM10011609_33640 [Lentzea pudingi]|uniref:Uncharacterized protein n=1 Tax=Lentzea pudingi TaxID=1789439 RepID=A0ABQ2HYD5_9PSEU|nr:hypothetical protein GCM10011609_33640 [Lentzea pudingi]